MTGKKEVRTLIARLEHRLRGSSDELGIDLRYGDLKRSGTKVVGAQQSAIAALTNSQADTTTDGTLEALNAVFSNAEVERNISELNVKIDAILAILRTHGLIAT